MLILFLVIVVDVEVPYRVLLPIRNFYRMHYTFSLLDSRPFPKVLHFAFLRLSLSEAVLRVTYSHGRTILQSTE